jgi:hypothetical protein
VSILSIFRPKQNHTPDLRVIGVFDGHLVIDVPEGWGVVTWRDLLEVEDQVQDRFPEQYGRVEYAINRFVRPTMTFVLEDEFPGDSLITVVVPFMFRVRQRALLPLPDLFRNGRWEYVCGLPERYSTFELATCSTPLQRALTALMLGEREAA